MNAVNKTLYRLQTTRYETWTTMAGQEFHLLRSYSKWRKTEGKLKGLVKPPRVM